MIFPPFSNSTTSRDAAESIVPVSKSLRYVIWRTIVVANGCTAQGIEKHLGISGNTVRPRIRELVKAGRVYDSGETQLLPSGRKAIIWRAR